MGMAELLGSELFVTVLLSIELDYHLHRNVDIKLDLHLKRNR